MDGTTKLLHDSLEFVTYIIENNLVQNDALAWANRLQHDLKHHIYVQKSVEADDRTWYTLHNLHWDKPRGK